jgi:hypothetical protein
MADQTSTLDTIRAAYYPQVLQEGAAARGRAQNGYSIAAAVAGAITAAGVFAKLTVDDLALVIVGGLAIVAWIATAIVYLWAVSGEPPQPSKDEATTPDEFIQAVIELARQDRKQVQGRITVANVAAVVATVLSAAAILIGLLATGDEDRGTLVFTTEGKAAMTEVCHGISAPFRVKAKAADLTAGDQVPVEVLSGCADRSVHDLVIDRGAIALVARDD